METDYQDTLNVGVIGLGHWGPNVVRNFMQHPQVGLRYVCDQNGAAIDRVKKAIPGSFEGVSEAARIFDDPEIQAVAVITPATTHYELVRAALESGKHVLSEKPLALKAWEIEDLIEHADRRGLKLMVGHTFLFNDSVRKIGEISRSGRLGQLFYATATRTHLGTIRDDVSAVWDLAPHDVAILNYLFGLVPERVSAVGSRILSSTREDVAFLTLVYPGGIIAQVHVSWIDSNKTRKLALIGSQARVVFDDLDLGEPVRIFEKGLDIAPRGNPDFGEFQFLVRDGDIISPAFKRREPLGNMINSFVRVVLDEEENVSDGRFALAVTQTIVAAHRSIELGGTPVEVESSKEGWINEANYRPLLHHIQ